MNKRINNTEELLNSIANDQTLILKGTEYPISEFTLSKYNKNVYYKDAYDGRELWLNAINKLEINGFNGAHIHASPRYAYVMCFGNCSEIKIDNIKFGHQPESGGCQGGVLGFENCQDIVLENLELYGCGRVGLSISNSKNIFIKDSIITKCTEGLIELKDCENIIFANCEFTENFSSESFIRHCNNIIFASCKFQNNQKGWNNNDYIIDVLDSSYGISQYDCILENNDVNQLFRLI